MGHLAHVLSEGSEPETSLNSWLPCALPTGCRSIQGLQPWSWWKEVSLPGGSALRFLGAQGLFLTALCWGAPWAYLVLRSLGSQMV